MSDTPFSIDFRSRDEAIKRLCEKVFGATPVYPTSHSNHVKQSGAVTICRNGYVEDLEGKLAEARAQLTALSEAGRALMTYAPNDICEDQHERAVWADFKSVLDRIEGGSDE